MIEALFLVIRLLGFFCLLVFLLVLL